MLRLMLWQNAVTQSDIMEGSMNLIKRIKHKLGRHPLLRPIVGDNKQKRAERHESIRNANGGQNAPR